MKRTTIWLTNEQVEKLKQVSTQDGLKPAQLIRAYIADGLRKRSKVV